VQIQNRETFWNIDSVSERLSAFWNVELVQSRAGALCLDFCHVSIGNCVVYECRTNVELVASGARSDQFVTISLITSDCAASRYRGQELKAGQLLLMEPRGEVFQQISAGHRQVAVSIPVHLFRKVAAAEFIAAERVDDFLAWRVMVPNARRYKRLQRHLSGILRGNGPPPERPDADVYLTEIVLGILFDEETRQTPVGLRQNQRRIVWESLDLIHAHPHRVPSILELCTTVGVSRRALFYAFAELLGLSPSAYIKKFRLSEARRLIINNRQERCIQRVARGLGFVHEGQFSIDYSSAFGESPSQTRQRFLGLHQDAPEGTQ
jgi:AraC family ethanolamine operon transcriptional activator